MNTELVVLCFTAAVIGFIHTVLGPDHYIPFIAMSRAGRWSMARTAVVTVLCGAGHIMSSVVLGIVGIVLGIGVMRLEALEACRGNLAAWVLIGFGFTYFVWGIHRALRNRSHSHVHFHKDFTLHAHNHSHTGEHAHVHEGRGGNITAWVLFVIFVLGPCEPLIPLLMYPAAKSSISGLLLVTAVFGGITIATMLGIVMISSWGMSFVRLGRFERYTHALAGGTICLSGLAIYFLGL